MIKNLLSAIRFIKNYIYLDRNEKEYEIYNLKKWKKYNPDKPRFIILLDLFNWYPWIHFWSYIVNFFIKKYNLEAKYFYFDLYQGKASKFETHLTKLKKIYRSFNVVEGISEYNFKYSKSEKLRFEKNFKINSKNKFKLLQYKKKNILIGDLIYDTYLRITGKPTIDLSDKLLKKTFFRAEKIFDECEKFFKKNKVFAIMPSHVCYVPYGIIARIAASKKINIIKHRSVFHGTRNFHIRKLSNECLVDAFPYWNYKKNFKKLKNSKKKLALKIGKNILKQRLSGNFDTNLPYMLKNPFAKNNAKINSLDCKKENIIIFAHSYTDNPHRFRSMIFPDFYHQINFLLNLSTKLKNFNWYYKPHPAELKLYKNIHLDFKRKFKNVKFLNRSVGHHEILKLKPKCIITNHGSICHEFAFFKTPVINTGDNPHINYKFCLNIKNINELKKVMYNLNYHLKKIKFNKDEIYEFMYMNFYHHFNEYKRKQLIKDTFFSTKKDKINLSTKLLKYFVKNKSKNDKKIFNYLECFTKSEIK